MLKVWGTLDILYIAIYMLAAIAGGKVPFFSHLQASHLFVKSYGNSIPMVMTGLSLILVMSIAGSGYALSTGRRIGRLLVYWQFPFRLLLVMPSVFFLPMLCRPLRKVYGVIALMLLALGTEVWKLISVRRAYMQPHQSLKATPASGAP